MAYGEVTYRQSLVRLVGENEPDAPRSPRARRALVSGCAILLARSALESIGAFDEEFFAYHEEVDWCATARERGPARRLRATRAGRSTAARRARW